MEKLDIMTVVYFCVGILLLFIGVIASLMEDKTHFTNMCGGAVVLFGLALSLTNVFDIKPKTQALGIFLGFTGLLFVGLVILSGIYQSLSDFGGFGKFFLGVLMMVGAWFVLSPPNVGRDFFSGSSVEEDDYGTGSLSSMSDNDSHTKRLGLSRMSNDDSKNNIIDTLLADIRNTNTSLDELAKTNPDLAGKIQSTIDYYNPNAGVFGSWARRIRGEGRSKLLEVLNKEQQLLIEQAALFEKQVIEGKKNQAEYKMFIARNTFELIELQGKAELIAAASKKEMLPEDLSTVRKEQEFLDIRIKEEQALAALQEKREDEALRRNLQLQQEQFEREQKAEQERIKRSLDAARAYKMNEHSITDEYRSKMQKALIELEAIEARTDITDKTKAALKIAKENEAENLRRIITARERKTATDEESFI